MDTRKRLKDNLNKLFLCHSATTKATIETLLKIHRNILFNKDDPKYRELKLHNPTFKNQVWDVPPARDFMINSGWIQATNTIHFNKDENLMYIIDSLLEYRLVTPRCSEWKEEVKIENMNVSEQREADLRAKAALDRDKELKECKRDQMYRKELAEKIKQQIADDRKHRRKFVDDSPYK